MIKLDRPTVKTGQAAYCYEWVEHWARIPEGAQSRTNGRTHGIAISANGQVIVFHQANPAVLLFDAHGNLMKSWGDRFLGAHGLTLVQEGGEEFLWLTDQYSGEVVKTTIEGQTIMNLGVPDLPVYKGGKFSPTWVAVYEERFGGNGDIWVADGYGRHQVHRYNKKGEYLSSISGREGNVGAFRCPHGIWIDTRSVEPELYVADRSNHCVQVYGLDGKFKYSFGHGIVYSPCGFTPYGEFLIIPEIHARVAVLDTQKNLVCYLGENVLIVDEEGWPDLPEKLVQPGRFVSPHSVAVDQEGNLYIVEWMVGGRITKLVREK